MTNDFDRLINDEYIINSFCKSYDEANDSLDDLRDILDMYGYISIADWYEWENPSYYEDASVMDRLTDMQIGWRSIDAFHIKPGNPTAKGEYKYKQLKSFYYIFADPPVVLNNLNEAIDELVREKTFEVNVILKQIDELTAMKKGA